MTEEQQDQFVEEILRGLCRKYNTFLNMEQTEEVRQQGIQFKCELTISFNKARVFSEITYAPSKSQAKSIALGRLMMSILSFGIESASGKFEWIVSTNKKTTTMNPTPNPSALSEGEIKVKTGFYNQFPIPLFVNIEIRKWENIRNPKTLRVGYATGGSTCHLYVATVDEVDRLISRLEEIKKELQP